MPGDVDLAVSIDRGHEVLAAVVLGPASDVAHAAVGIGGADGELQGVPGLERGPRGLDLEAGNPGIVLARPHGPRGDPVGKDAIFRRAGIQFLTAAVRQGQGWLEQEQTADRMLAVDAPAQSLAREDEVIGFWIVTAQRQFQAALARQGPMARTRVAADPRQDGDDLVGEAYRLCRGRGRGKQGQGKTEG